MTEERLDLFDLIMDKVKQHKGYTVIGILKDAEPGANLINFDTKEEFEQEFEQRQNRFYGGYQLKASSNLDFYCDDGPYLAIDGVLQR